MANNNNDTTVHHGTVEGGGGNTNRRPDPAKNLIAIFCYLWILIIIPFLTGSVKDPFVKFHVKQGLVLLIFDAVGWIIGIVFGGNSIGAFVTSTWSLVALILVIVGVITALQGKEKELPLIGQYANSFKF